MKSRPRLLLSHLVLLSTFGASAFAAVVTDPTLTTGSSAIDPSGSRTVDVQATGSASIATLTSHPDFRGAIQSGWTGFVGASTSTNNIFSFTDSTLPDISFDVSGSFGATSGGNIGNAVRTTSATSGYNLVASGGGSVGTPLTVTLTINLGSYNSGTSIFTNGATVDGIGFTLADLRAGQTATATFFNASNVLLSTQSIVSSGTFTDNDSQSNSLDGYFGYKGNGSLANGVSKIVLNVTYTAGGTFAKGLDDLAFTSAISAVPEPSAYSMMAGCASMIVAFAARSRRRQH
jgi:hypothetical protein